MLSFFTTYTLRFLLFVHPVHIAHQDFTQKPFFEKRKTPATQVFALRGFFFFQKKQPFCLFGCQVIIKLLKIGRNAP
jgi:hypothetical protein